jgi:site-specific DNA-methyltransferase (adenine-specific)
MIVEQKALTDIKPYIKNPRKKWDIQKVAQSIKEFGFQQPIVVDSGGTIIVGHGRYEAAKLLKLNSIPVTIADLPPEKAKAYRIADNKTNEFSEWDISLLQQEFTDLLDANFDLELTGFDHDELESLITGEKAGLTDDDAVPELPDEPKSKLGDIYKLGEHRLMCGDSTSITDFDKLSITQADMIFTDPPYGMEYGGGRAEGSTKKGSKVKAHGMIKGDDLKGDNLINLVRDALTTSYLKTKTGASAYICFTWRTYSEFEDALNKAGLKVKNCIVWNKRSIGLGNSHYRPQHEFIFYCGEQWYGNKAQSDVWELSRGDTSKYVHPTQKPVQLIEKAIKNSSKSGDVIIDCFGGSGSTLIACEKTNRKCNMMELDPKYLDRIVKRWEDYTGKKAELLNG